MSSSSKFSEQKRQIVFIVVVVVILVVVVVVVLVIVVVVLQWEVDVCLIIILNCFQDIMACAVARNCCISDVPSQWEGQNFDPPTAPTFLNRSEWNSKPRKISGIRPHMQNLVDVGRWEGGLRREGIFRYFFVLSFFCILAHTHRSHQKTNHDHLWLKTRVSA